MRFLLIVLFSTSIVARAKSAAFAPDNGVEIKDGDLIAGTAHIGKDQIQPHYLIDLESPTYQKISARLRQELSTRNLSELEKIDYVAQYVSRQFERSHYDDPKYTAAALKHVEEGRPIKLSTLLENKAAVCRGQNMLMHLLLKEQGIETKYVTAKVASGPHSRVMETEDHSFLVYKRKSGDEKIVLDA